MPTDAIDFVLGELFQKKWQKRADDFVRNHASWGNLQKERLTQMLDWMKEKVAKAEGAPWLALKHAKPPAGLLLSSDQ
jgi:hypothetical protein